MTRITTEVDQVLEQLVAERREEVVDLQKTEANRLEQLEKSGGARLSQLQKELPDELSKALVAQDKTHQDLAADTVKDTESIVQKMSGYEVAPEVSAAAHPGLVRGSLAAEASAVGWVYPYYGTLHGSNGAVYWQGYNPGTIDASTFASGAGSGLFGTGAGSFTVYMDWWFTYLAPLNRNYSHTVYVPFNGFHIVRADDGFWDSKEAKVKIDLTTIGYQYNYKASATTNVLSISDDNININDRFDGWRTMYYAQLLGADQAYLRVTASLYVYARGGGSHAQLNFSDGSANYLGVPIVSVD
ncbi:hypothetical protein IWX64_000728 [Arthrobacter sp. CAN_A212]|uniref:hypothetical protein n=1 Tax=Arthrobacter sp. CAN_A212 TaxID=2787719 RepID=UPI0018CAFF3A